MLTHAHLGLWWAIIYNCLGKPSRSSSPMEACSERPWQHASETSTEIISAHQFLKHVLGRKTESVHLSATLLHRAKRILWSDMLLHRHIPPCTSFLQPWPLHEATNSYCNTVRGWPLLKSGCRHTAKLDRVWTKTVKHFKHWGLFIAMLLTGRYSLRRTYPCHLY